MEWNWRQGLYFGGLIWRAWKHDDALQHLLGGGTCALFWVGSALYHVGLDMGHGFLIAATCATCRIKRIKLEHEASCWQPMTWCFKSACILFT